MSLGKFKKFIFISLFLFVNVPSIFAEDKIESVPLINLEDLSPTFEEDKDELEKIEKKNVSLNNTENILEESNVKKNEKIYLSEFKQTYPVKIKTLKEKEGLSSRPIF